MAQSRAKRTRWDFSLLSRKNWLLDYFDRNPRLSAKDLGQVLADDIGGRINERRLYIRHRCTRSCDDHFRARTTLAHALLHYSLMHVSIQQYVLAAE
jgi:hypothetical protein